MSLEIGEALFIAFVALMLFFSVTSNFLVVVIVVRNPRMRNVTNICIANLAVSDILLAAFVLPQNLHDISHTENYHEGAALCSVVNFFPLFCIMVSIYSMVIISFERRRAIVLSMDQQTMKIIKFILPALWIGSFAVCIPTLVEYTEFEVFNPVTNQTDWRCGSIQSSTYSLSNAFMLICVAYLIPLFLVIINYVIIIRFIWKNGKDAEASNQRRLVSKNRMKIIKMMVIAAALFAASWAPYFTLLAVGKVTGHDGAEESAGALNLIRLTLSAFSTAYNVVLYVVYNKNFRDGFKSMCPACFKRARNSIAPSFVATSEIQFTANK